MIRESACKLALRIAVVLVALGVLAACEHQQMPLTRCAATFVPPPETRGNFFAGAALADVTPPAGASTFGHAVDSHVANGYWTRLYCRAFVFVDAATGSSAVSNAMAIVPCDLAAMSTLLQRSVAAKLKSTAIPPQRLFLSAIHTHAGPAHYFDGSFYGGLASSQVPGFDPEMVDFLAMSIAGAIDAAYLQAMAARAQGRVAELRWLHGLAWGLTHNRNLAAFRQNGEPKLVAVQDPAQSVTDLDPASLAIDPNLDILEIVEKGQEPGKAGDPGKRPLPIGWLAFFAMHPTVLPSGNRYFGSDAFGVATRLAEQELGRLALERGARDRPPPLVGLVNTNEGDLSPRWSVGDVEETITIGRRLAEHMLRVWHENKHAKFEDQPRIAATYLEVKLPGNTFGLEHGQKLCDSAELGLAAIWGAADHQSMLIDARDVSAPSYDLNRLRRGECQAPKRKALGYLQTAMGGAGAFPVEVPLGLVQIGDTSIAFVPAEVTATVGFRIRKRVLAAMPATGVHRALIGGLTNGYFEYVATPEEYQLQLYEGGSTLYGQYTAPFLAATFENMAQRLAGGNGAPPPDTEPDVAHAFDYETGPVRHRLANSSEDPVTPKALGMCELPRATDLAGPPRFCFAWLDGPPNVISSPPHRPVALIAMNATGHPPLVQINLQNPLSAMSGHPPLGPDRVVLSDSGFDFRTKVHGRSGDEWVWTTLFEPTPDEWTDLGSQSSLFAFRVGDAKRQPELTSLAFSLGEGKANLAICSPETTTFCGMAE
ncbi:MAG TPA: neutral/alkaline non-lysosomal ceramidase N-terminal domain-containing protein [Polyangiaceae bacterium]